MKHTMEHATVTRAIIDSVLTAGLLTLAWWVIAARGLFRSVVLFLAFGLVVALTWLRLGALDLALAEAAVGVGITGVLLLVAYRDLALRDALIEPPMPWALRGAIAAATLAVSALVALAVVASQDGARPLVAELTRALPASGVDSPVTAILLNFRGYDTLLEIAVLLAAVVAIASLRPGFPVAPPEPGDPGLARLLAGAIVPPAVVVGGYLFWAGTHSPGGAFPGAAVLAAALILSVLSRRLTPHGHASHPQRIAAAAGLGILLGVALAVIPLSGGFLDYPQAGARALIVTIEAALTGSVALSLALLCTGSAGLGGWRRP